MNEQPLAGPDTSVELQRPYSTGTVETPVVEPNASNSTHCVPQMGYGGIPITFHKPHMEAMKAAAKARKPKRRTFQIQGHATPCGRNAPCFCGSGKKYKKCHGQQPVVVI